MQTAINNQGSLTTVPKSQYMKKTITRTGPNGTIPGCVEVIFNTRTVTTDGPEKRQTSYHVVRGSAGHKTYLSHEFTNKDDAVFEAKKMERVVENELTDMAFHIKDMDPVEVNLAKLGYV